jgi:hypothetical protein
MIVFLVALVNDRLFARLFALFLDDGRVLTLAQFLLDDRGTITIIVPMVGANRYTRADGSDANANNRVLCRAGAARASPAAAMKAIANFIVLFLW